MALKKPSDLFENRNTQKVKNTENHSILTEEEQSLNLFENFQKFSKKLEHYQENDEKIEIILSEIDVLKEEINKSINQKKLDEAMMSQLFVVETAIRDIQKKVSGINHKELETVRTDIDELNEVVKDFLPKYKKLVLEIREFIDQDVSIKKKVVDIEIEVLRNEKKLKDVEKYLKENYKDIISLREQVFEEINNIPIGNVEKNISDIKRKVEYIESVYTNIKPEDIVRDVISETSSTKTKDPLTPLDQKFVTLDQLKEHYRLFINRIQQQLSSLGGGGETQLKYLDDIVGIATNPSAYDGKFLKYDHPTKKFVFDDAIGSNIVDTFPIGDYGDFSSIFDAFGICLSCYDCLTEPTTRLSEVDFALL